MAFPRTEFADFKNARRILCGRDEFVLQMKPFERKLRMRGERASIDNYLAFLERNILDWEDDEKQVILESIEIVNELMCDMNLMMEQKLVFIKTTGKEEWDGVYTRANAIVMPQSRLASARSKGRFSRLILHELYHVITRKSPRMRTAMDRLIGFHSVIPSRVRIPPELEKRSLTNPDSTKRYCFHSMYQGTPIKVIPVLSIEGDVSHIDSIHELMRKATTKFVLYPADYWSKRPAMKKILIREELECVPEATRMEGEESFDPSEIMAEKLVALLHTHGENIHMNGVDSEMLKLLRKYLQQR